MLVQCTQREEGEREAGGVVVVVGGVQSARPDDEPRKDAFSIKAKQGKYLSEFMQVPFIQ